MTTATPRKDTAELVLADLVAHWADEAATLPNVTDDTWADEGRRLGLASQALRARARALVAAAVEQQDAETCPVCGLRAMTDDEIEDGARGAEVPADVCPGCES